MKELVRFLAALTDPTRLRLLRLLHRQDLCVCELMDALRLPQYKVSATCALLGWRRDAPIGTPAADAGAFCCADICSESHTCLGSKAVQCCPAK